MTLLLASFAQLMVIGLPIALAVIRWPAKNQATMIGSYPTLFDQQLSLSQSNERVIDLAWANGYGMPQPAVK